MDATTFVARTLRGNDARGLAFTISCMEDVLEAGTGECVELYREALPAIRQALKTARPGWETVERDERPAGKPGTGSGARRELPMVTEKQLYWITKLAQEKDLRGVGSVLGPIRVPADPSKLSRKHASSLLDRLFAAPRK